MATNAPGQHLSYPTVQLTSDDQDLASRVATVRNDKPSSTSKRLGSRTDLGTHLIGLYGEIAVSRYLGLDIDETSRPGGDNGVDFVYNGYTIDVKTRPQVGYDLMFYDDWSDLRADIFILVYINEETMVAKLPGWAWDYEVVLTARQQKDRRGEVRRIFEPSQLQSIQTLSSSIKELS